MKERMIISLLLATLLSSIIIGCKEEEKKPGITEPSVVADTIPPIPGWELVWNDEFTDSTIDLTKWSHETGGHGWGNNELQFYTNRRENSFIENGKLVIQAREENYQGMKYTSARMRSANKGDWTYGLFVVRAKLPYGKGLWPAIWMLPTDWAYGGWPASGEIDIMELLGDNIKKVYGTIHFEDASGGHGLTGGNYTLPSGNFAEEFHTFIVAWDSVGFRWMVDSTMYFSTIKGKPFDKRFHMLLNVAVGGNWPGNPDGFTIFPQRMEVEYVRVYRKSQ